MSFVAHGPLVYVMGKALSGKLSCMLTSFVMLFRSLHMLCLTWDLRKRDMCTTLLAQMA